MATMRLLNSLALLALAGASLADRPTTITFVHTNDLHSHVAPTIIQKKPYGGYARQATLIKQFRAKDPNVVLLNAGDTFQGTLYFNVYEGLADLAFLNALGYQAMAIGNHEFDRGPVPLGTFAKHAKFPILSANIDFSKEPALPGLIPSTIIQTKGGKIGVVGATTPDTPDIASPGPNVRFKELVSSVQLEVDDLTKQGINKIVVLSHCGYSEEKDLASRLRDVDLIIGGHSHTPLGTPDLPGWPKAGGPYPTLAKDATGATTYIVQAWEWGKVLGRIQLDFDAKGVVKRVRAAQAFVLDETIPEDPEIKALETAFERPLLALQTQPVGETKRLLARDREPGGDATMAEVIADAMLAATAKTGSVAAFINGGGVRGQIEAGRITYGQAVSVQPFSNTLTVLEVTGEELLKSFNRGIEKPGGMLFPSAGTSYAIANGQATQVIIAGQPLDLTKTYRITLLGFTASGGDSHEFFKNAKGKRIDTGFLDIDALVEYLKANSPLNRTPEYRVKKG